MASGTRLVSSRIAEMVIGSLLMSGRIVEMGVGTLLMGSGIVEMGIGRRCSRRPERRNLLLLFEVMELIVECRSPLTGRFFGPAEV